MNRIKLLQKIRMMQFEQIEVDVEEQGSEANGWGIDT